MKTMLFFILMFISQTIFAATFTVDPVTTLTDGSPVPYPPEYRVHCGPDTGNYLTAHWMGLSTSGTFSFTDGRYYCAAFAILVADDNRSDYSNEVIFDSVNDVITVVIVQLSAPTNLGVGN